MHDAALAPAGRHVMSVLVQWVPHRLRGATWDSARREALGNLVIQTLSDVLPGFATRVVAKQVLTPKDIEDRYGATGGSLTHGELTLDQILFMRPVPGCPGMRRRSPGCILAAGHASRHFDRFGGAGRGGDRRREATQNDDG